MKIFAKIQNKILANGIQQHIYIKNMHLNLFNMQKFTVIHDYNSLKKKNHMILSIYVKKII